MADNRQMAKFGAMGFAVLALSSGAIAALIVSRMIAARQLEQEKKLPVVVTTRAISAGEPLVREALRIAIYPETNIPVGAVRDIEPLFHNGKAPIAATGITAGEPLIAARLADAALGTAMAARVQTGMRAVAVKVDNAVARAGLLYPGAKVDVVGTVRNSRSMISSSRIAIENVRVLSVESRLDVETYKPQEQQQGGAVNAGSEKSDTVVTIEVTPEQAEMVILAEREGKVDLALRNATDAENSPTAGATAMKLLTTNASSAAAAAAMAGDPEERRRPAARRSPKVAAGGGKIETFHAK